MNRALLHLALSCLAAGLVGAGPVGAADPPERPLIDLAKEGVEGRFAASSADQVTVSRAEGAPGIVVTCKPGQNKWPGITLTPEEKVWDLSAFGRVEARVVNTGATRMTLALRIDNDGDWQSNPWNSENAYLNAGETGVVRVRFGYSWGKPGFALDPAKVVRLLLFTDSPKEAQSFRIESIVAAGAPGEKPPVNPADVLAKPKEGILLGQGVQVDGATQLTVRGGKAEIVAAGGAQALRATLPAGAADASVMFKPAAGRWDLRDWLQVVVRARNAGAAPFTLKGRLESNSGSSEWTSGAAPLAPGAAQELVLPFAGPVIAWDASTKQTAGSRFTGDRTSGVTVSASGEGERILVVESVRAVLPPAPPLPQWLGKRPPVPGDWKQTLAEEFDRPTLDESRWAIYHPNYWDKRSHFSKENAILDGGMLTLRFEKKRGHHNDDAKQPETDWATGFITSTHKWTQRYGYFESRMKLPKAPGMWPAFWMMPDRGPNAGPGREGTENGGMEFDILEYLARYGPYHYNIACHWDGYGKDHRSLGTESIYFQPDKEGFVVAGLLWEPGKASFYVNGTLAAVWESPRVCSVPMYILYTAVSGGWGGNDLTGEGLPSDLVIDWVRAWQRSDWAEAKAP